jgi:hypothetical protein
MWDFQSPDSQTVRQSVFTRYSILLVHKVKKKGTMGISILIQSVIDSPISKTKDLVDFETEKSESNECCWVECRLRLLILRK